MHLPMNGVSLDDLAVLQFLHRRRLEVCTTAAMDVAAANGHLEVVQWLHRHRSEGCTTEAMNLAAAHGHLEIVSWLHEHRFEGATVSAMDTAAANGHLGVLAWLHQHRFALRCWRWLAHGRQFLNRLLHLPLQPPADGFARLEQTLDGSSAAPAPKPSIFKRPASAPALTDEERALRRQQQAEAAAKRGVPQPKKRTTASSLDADLERDDDQDDTPSEIFEQAKALEQMRIQESGFNPYQATFSSALQICMRASCTHILTAEASLGQLSSRTNNDQLSG
ncbi:hypothetical protein AeRB84_009417 [Aphanomyces euteiches]|nr:hypothetical protein AeRB84_009417 [Aphanomyces euteiches]